MISMVFLSSVNFDYGEIAVMAFVSFLPFSHSLITRRGWCGGVDWELQSTLFTDSWLSGLAGLRLQNTHRLLLAHTHTTTLIHPCLLWIPIFTHAQRVSQGNQDISAAYLYAGHEYSCSHLLSLET